MSDLTPGPADEGADERLLEELRAALGSSAHDYLPAYLDALRKIGAQIFLICDLCGMPAYLEQTPEGPVPRHVEHADAVFCSFLYPRA